MRLLTKESGDSAEFGLGPRAIGFGRQPPATASHEAERKEKQSHQRPLKPLQTQGAGQDSREQGRTRGSRTGRACGCELPHPRAVRHGASATGLSPSAAPGGSRLLLTLAHPLLGGEQEGAVGETLGGPRLEGGVSLHTSPCQPHEGRWQGSPPRPVCCHQAERGGVRLLSCTP